MTLSGAQYQAVAGETFDIISLVVYGDERYACDLMYANPTLCMIPMFTGGELIDIPEIEISNDNPGESMPVTAPWKE